MRCEVSKCPTSSLCYSQRMEHVFRWVSSPSAPLRTKTRGCCCVQILLNASTRRDAAGNIVGAIFVGNDTTDLKRAELRARGAAEDLARLIDTANAPIFGVSTNGLVTEWNQVCSVVACWPHTHARFYASLFVCLVSCTYVN